MIYRWGVMLSTVAVLLINGCVSVHYISEGKFDGEEETFTGSVEPGFLTSRGRIELTGQKSGITCSGDSYVTYFPPAMIGCPGRRGEVAIECSDDRYIETEWYLSDCTSGFGSGKDEKGVTFEYTFELQ